MLSPTAKQCKAKSKRSGKRCQNPAVTGFDVCRIHGANPGSNPGCPPEKAKGNKNAMRYGAYVNKVLDDEELVVFREFYKLMHQDFILNKSSDRMSAELACIYWGCRLIQFFKKGAKKPLSNQFAFLQHLNFSLDLCLLSLFFI